MNPADYEYDPNVYHLRHIPGVGLYTFGNNESEESIQQATSKISLEAELDYANHHKDPVLLDTFKRYYKRKNGEDFTGTDQEAVDEFMSDFAYIDNNLTFGLGKVLIDQTHLSEQDKFDVGLLYDRYERTNITGEGSRPFMDQLADVSYATVTDPINAIGVFTGGIGFAARATVGKVASQAAKKAIVEGWRNSMAGAYGRAVAKRPITTAMISGAGWASTYDIEKQSLEIGSGMQEARHEVTGESESFDYDELITTAVAGAGFGGIIGGGAKAASKFFSKGDYSKILGRDRTKSTTAELRAEMQSRGFDYEEPLTTITKKELSAANKKFNKTQEKIEEIKQLPLPFPSSRGQAAIKHEYPFTWISAEGDEVKVTVSNISPSNVKDAPEVVTLRGQNGEEFKVSANDQGGIINPTKRFKSDDNIRKILDSDDIQKMGDDYEIDALGRVVPVKLLSGNASPMKKAHQFLVRNFTSHFGLGPESAERIRDAERMLTSAGEKVDILIKRFEKEWKTQHGTSFDQADRGIHHTFIKALTTIERDDDVKILLPENSELKKVIDEWRSLIAETSSDLIKSGAFSKYKLNNKGERILDDAGKPIENNFFKTLQKGEKEKTYLHRMYSLYEDTEYAEKALKERLGEDYNIIRNYFRDEHELTEFDAGKIMTEIATRSSDRKLGQLGPLGRKKLIEDKGLTVENIDNKYVKMLLGEITDPRQLFAGTVFRTRKIVEDYKLKRDLVSIGLRRGSSQKPFMARSDISGEWKSIEGSANARSFALNEEQLRRMWNGEANELLEDKPAPFMDNPFDGIFVSPEYKKYYDVMAGFYDQKLPVLQKLMAGSTFAFNLSHTVLSPTTHMRNFTGGMLQNVYNGILPWGSRAWRKTVASETNIEGNPAYSIFRRTVPMFNKFRKRGELDEGDVSRITRLIELGVVHNGMRAGIFKETYNIMIKEANPLYHLERKLIHGKGKGKLTKTVDKAAEVYEMSDNINKISAFESEFGWLFRAFGDGKNTDAFIKHADSLGVFNARKRLDEGESLSKLIEEATAKKVNMFTPTYSQLTGSSRLFRQVPIGNFVAFPMEVTRNYANSWRLASRELRSGSAVMRARGSIRAASLAGATGITVGGIGGLSAAINGVTDNEREALEDKSMLAEWEWGTNFFYTGKLKDGTLKAIPLGYTDPFSYLSRIAQVAMYSFNENESDAVLNSRLVNASAEAFKAAMDPYVVPAVGPATLMTMYKEISDVFEKDEEINIEAIGKSLNIAFTPTFVKDLYKHNLIPFTEPTKVTKWGTEIDPVSHTMLGWVSGIKQKNIHIPSKVGFAFSDADREKKANSSKFGKYIGDRQNWVRKDYKENIMQEYKDFINKEKEIARRVRTIYAHGTTLGLDRNKLLDLAISFDKSAEAVEAGPQKYRADLGKEYVASVISNHYPLSVLEGERRETIIRSLERQQGGDMTLLHDMDRYYNSISRNMKED
jgi:hypothetical protein